MAGCSTYSQTVVTENRDININGETITTKIPYLHNGTKASRKGYIQCTTGGVENTGNTNVSATTSPFTLSKTIDLAESNITIADSTKAEVTPQGNIEVVMEDYTSSGQISITGSNLESYPNHDIIPVFIYIGLKEDDDNEFLRPEEMDYYSIVFHINYSGRNDIETQNGIPYNIRSKLRPNTFTRNGYSFVGWSTKPEGTQEYDDEGNATGRIIADYSNGQTVYNLSNAHNDNIPAEERDDGVIHLYAIWSKDIYTIQFMSNGGSGTMSNQEMTYGSNEPLSKNLFTRENYTFLYWTETSINTGSGFTDESTEASTLTKNFNSTVKLYAQWSRVNYYYIEYDGNESTSGSMTRQKVLSNTRVNLLENTFERANYKFIGWNTERDGSGTSYEDCAEVENLSEEFESSFKLYAQWQKETFVIRYHSNYSEIDTFVDVTVNKGDSVLIPSAEDLNIVNPDSSKKFKAWMNNRINVSYKPGSYNVNFGPNNGIVDLYAYWVNSFNITFDANGGEGSMESMSIEENVSNNLTPCSFTREFYEFLGWSTDPDASIPDYQDKASITLNSNITLYAIWKRKTATIIFKADYTTGETPDQTVLQNIPSTLNKNSYVRDGYIFKGWTTDVNGTTVEYEDEDLYTATQDKVVLYAIFEEDLIKSVNVRDMNTSGTVIKYAKRKTTTGGVINQGTDYFGYGYMYSDTSSHCITYNKPTVINSLNDNIWFVNSNLVNASNNKITNLCGCGGGIIDTLTNTNPNILVTRIIINPFIFCRNKTSWSTDNNWQWIDRGVIDGVVPRNTGFYVYGRGQFFFITMTVNEKGTLKTFTIRRTATLNNLVDIPNLSWKKFSVSYSSESSLPQSLININNSLNSNHLTFDFADQLIGLKTGTYTTKIEFRCSATTSGTKYSMPIHGSKFYMN